MIIGSLNMAECIICLRTLDTEPCKDPEYFTSVFDAFCSLMKVNLKDQIQWNFEQENIPFCEVCFCSVNRLKGLNDQMQVIEKEISHIVQATKDKMNKSGCFRNITNQDDRVTYIRQEAIRGIGIVENPANEYEITIPREDSNVIVKVEIEEENNDGNTSSSNQHFQYESEVQENIEIFETLDESINNGNDETSCIDTSFFAGAVTIECSNRFMPSDAKAESTEVSTSKLDFTILDAAEKINEQTDLKLTEGKVKCNVCDKNFESMKKLKYHQRIHLEGKPYKCETCEKCFVVKERLVNHVKTHSGEKPFKCDTCDKCYYRRQHLLDHKRVHTGEKPYKCPVCGVGFARSTNLNDHRKVHTTNRPYKCGECSKDYKRKTELGIHERTHNTGQKPYKCDVCNKSFWWPYEFNRHQSKQTCRQTIKI